MNRTGILIFTALFIIGFFKANDTSAQFTIMRTDADSLVRLGTDHIYNVEFDEASKCFGQVIDLYPDHPAGYFLDAMVEWWKIWLYRKNETWDDIFLEKIENVIQVSDRILDSNEYELTGLFFKGGALGFRARFHTIRRNWLKAATDGREAFNLLMRCKEIAPGNHDIMLGTGIYNYFTMKFTEKYPSLKTLAAFLPKGDKRLGLLQLQAAARFARYAATEADVIRLQIYYQFETNYDKAYEIAKKLYDRYPKNTYFHRYLGKCYIIKNKRDSAEMIWKQVMLRYIDKWPGYETYAVREALYYLGDLFMKKGEYDRALKYFYKCDEACRKIDVDPSGFMVILNLKVGNIYDLQGKRELAIKQYEKVLRMNEKQGSHDKAERYLDRAYGK